LQHSRKIDGVAQCTTLQSYEISNLFLHQSFSVEADFHVDECLLP